MRSLQVLSIITVVFFGCNNSNQQSSHEPVKLEGIPDSAFWIGGTDGGNWYLIDSIDTIDQTARFKIYSDQAGYLLSENDFKLFCDSKEKINWNNLRSHINSFNGQTVLLKTISENGKYCYFGSDYP